MSKLESFRTVFTMQSSGPKMLGYRTRPLRAEVAGDRQGGFAADPRGWELLQAFAEKA